MQVDETLENYKNSIEKALAGFLSGKMVHELDDMEVAKANDIVSNMSLEAYMSLADALDREDSEAIMSIIGQVGAERSPMGESIKHISESGYMDADLFLKEGFTYFGVFEDEKLRSSVTKYLDENEVEYMQDEDGHVQMKFADREHAYRAEAAISRMIARSNPHYVRDDVEMEARKPFPDPGKKHRRFGKPTGLTGSSHHMRKLQKKNGGQGAFTEEDDPNKEAKIQKMMKDTKISHREAERLYNLQGKKWRPEDVFAEDDVEEGKKKKPTKPDYVRSGGPTTAQSGAGAHSAGNKKGKLAKQDPVKGKHKKDLKNLEESKMSDKKKIEEGVMGMAELPVLNRMRHLAGLPPLKEAEDQVEEESKEELDEALPVPMDDTPSIDDTVEEPMGDELPADDMGMDSEVPGDAMDIAPDMDAEMPGDDMGMDAPIDAPMDAPMDAPATDIAPAMPEPVGDVRTEIEGSIDTMLAKAPELKIADYKDVLSRAEDAVAQMRAMGSQYLKEGKKSETLREFADRQNGFKKARLQNLMGK